MSPRPTDLDVAPDSYSALMTPSDSPSMGSRTSIGALKGAGAGNPFSALGQAAGRMLAARFKPLHASVHQEDAHMEEGFAGRDASDRALLANGCAEELDSARYADLSSSAWAGPLHPCSTCIDHSKQM